MHQANIWFDRERSSCILNLSYGDERAAVEEGVALLVKADRPMQTNTTSFRFSFRMVAMLWLAFTVASCSPAQQERSADQADVDSIRTVIADIIAADNAGNLERVLALYTDDVILMPPGGDIIRGKPAAREHYRNIFQHTELDLTFVSEETQAVGDWAFDRGTTRGRAVPRSGGTATPIDDKYLMILKRQADGTWRIARLIWNRN